MVTDDQKPEVAQKPAELEELVKDYLWGFLRRRLGARTAVIIFLVAAAVWTFHGEMGELVADLHAQIVQWWPLPKAKPGFFTVAVARLENDDEKADMASAIAQDLRELEKSKGIRVLEFHRTIIADSDDDVPAGQAEARKWLTQSGAQVLIWGKVVTSPDRSVPELYWTTSDNRNDKAISDRYGLDNNNRLPISFQKNLSDILDLLVVTESSAFNAEAGHFVADRLQPFIERVRHLIEGDAARQWTSGDIARIKLILGNSLVTVGDQTGTNDPISEAIGLYRAALTNFQFPLDRAMTQNNLGYAMFRLGERESGTADLQQAVAAYRAALVERTRERAPLDWATTQNNLGNALETLGERESGTADLQ
jgi:hypothetical protein